MKKKPNSSKPIPIEIEEWDLTQQFGILPDDISLTQNIGCVGGKKKKDSSPKPEKD